MHHHPIDMLPRSGSGKEREDEPPAAIGLAAPVRFVREGPAPRAICPHCAGELELSTVGSSWRVHRPSDVADRLAVQLGALEREELHVLLLNTRNVVLDQVRVYQGNVSASLVRVAELFTEAVRRQARGVLLVHNHPSGDPTPSPDDLHLTAEATAAGKLLDIAVLDHIIIGKGSWVGLRERGVIDTDVPRTRAIGDGRGRSQRKPVSLRLHIESGEVRDDTGRPYDVGEAIETVPWVTALPSSGAPHQYAVDRRCLTVAWDVLICAISKHPDGYRGYHRGYQRPTRYWEFEGHRYWQTASTAYGGFTRMLNRCRLDSDTPRRVDQGAKPIAWVGPPWLEYGSPWPPGYIVEAGRHVYHRELDPRAQYRCADCGRRMYWEPHRPCPRCGTPADEVLRQA